MDKDSNPAQILEEALSLSPVPVRQFLFVQKKGNPRRNLLSATSSRLLLP